MTTQCPPPLFPFVQWDFSSANELLTDRRFYFFNYSRSALSFLVSHLLSRDNYFFIIPAYTCPTVIKSIAAHTSNYSFVDIMENLDFCENDLNEVIPTIPTHFKIALLATSLFGVSIRDYKKIYPDFTIIEDRAQATVDFTSSADYQLLSFGKGKLISVWNGGAVVTGDESIRRAYAALQTEHDFIKSLISTWLQVMVSRYFWSAIDKTSINPEKKSRFALNVTPASKMSDIKIKWVTNSIKAFDSSRQVTIATHYEKNLKETVRYDLGDKTPLLRYPLKKDMINRNVSNLCGISRMKGYRTTWEQAQAKRCRRLSGSEALACHSVFLPLHDLVSSAYIEKIVKIINSTGQK